METTLIKDHEERLKRSQDKLEKLLAFCAEHGWVDTRAAAMVMGVQRKHASSDLARAVKRGLLTKHEVEIAGWRRPWWRPTPAGTVEGLLAAGREIPDPLPDPRNMSTTTFQHESDCLLLAATTPEDLVWSRWIGGPPVKKGTLPDATLTGKITVAVEVERTVKNQRRYREIVASHLTAIMRGRFQKVFYFCPDPRTRDRVKGMILSITRVKIHGKEYVIGEKERACFRFATYEQYQAVPPKI